MSQRRTTLYDAHVEAGARFTDFGGWEMPVSFEGIRAEHAAVRSAVGKFDVSHMGQIIVEGPDATSLMQRLVTNDVTELESGDAQYAAITDEDGIIIDDTIVYRLAATDDPRYLFVPNAGHNEALAERWRRHRDEWELTASVDDRTGSTGMIAVQGPDAVEHIDELADADIDGLSRFGHRDATIADTSVTVARTGYTGEDGVELVVPAADAPAVWSAIDGPPIGLGARDTLRLEAGLLLGGNEFDHESNPRTPLEAGIDFAVDLDTPFVGRDALRRQRDAGLEATLVGFGLADRGVPRTGYAILDEAGEPIGTVTSGTKSPTLDRPIGLGYVDPAFAAPETAIAVEVRGDAKRGKVESLPFVG